MFLSRSFSGLIATIFLLAAFNAYGNQPSSTGDKASPADSQPTTKTTEATPMATTKATKTLVTLKTSLGEIEIELDAQNAPLSVDNFLKYAKAGHYSGTIFHRVIPGFMIQGGGFESGMQQKQANAPIPNEANNGLLNDEFTIAMARTPDPHSASSQFFINVNNNASLNFSSETPSGWGYAVFGRVTKGQDVVKSIEVVETGRSGGHGDVPLEEVIIESVDIAE